MEKILRVRIEILVNSGFLSGHGGIGRRARFRFWWETVQVQVLLSAVKSAEIIGTFLFRISEYKRWI